MTNTKLWYLEQFNFIRDMNINQRLWLAKQLKHQYLRKNETIFFCDENPIIYFLKKGTVKIVSISDEGEEDIKYLVKRGNMFGELGFAGGESPGDMAIALENCVLCSGPVAVFEDLVQRNPRINREVTKILGRRVRKIERRLMSMIFKDAKTRIKEFIYDFVTEFGTKEEELWIAKNFLKHGEIAKLTATSRQTVASTMNDLRKKGFLNYDDKMIELPEGKFKATLSPSM